MINTTITPAALRSRILSTPGLPFVVAVGGAASWRYDVPGSSPLAISRMRNQSAVAPIHAVRPTDVVPATQAGRGSSANTKQDRPPRREPR